MTDPTLTATTWDELNAALTQAWHRHSHQPIPEPVQAAFLQAATEPAADPLPDAHLHSDTETLAQCHRDLAGQLLDLVDRIRQYRNRSVEHRTGLRRAQLGVRAAALGTLSANPDLEDRLRDALADWGLPPIDAAFDVTFSVRITVRADAVDADEATQLAVSQLRDGLARLPSPLSANVDDAECIDVTQQ